MMPIKQDFGINLRYGDEVSACFYRQTKREPVRPPLCTHQKWEEKHKKEFNIAAKSCLVVMLNLLLLKFIFFNFLMVLMCSKIIFKK
jgi:hypothetical protein